MTFDNHQYHLVVDWGFVNKKLKKYQKNIKSKIKKDITLLKYNPNKGDIIDAYKTATLRKKRYQEVEVYYSVENNVVVVLDVKYLGKVKLRNIVGGIKSGSHNKKTTTKQQRIIKKEKKKFNDEYKRN